MDKPIQSSPAGYCSFMFDEGTGRYLSRNGKWVYPESVKELYSLRSFKSIKAEANYLRRHPDMSLVTDIPGDAAVRINKAKAKDENFS